MKTIYLLTPIVLSLAACSSLFNTAGKSEFACPGMPEGVVCKTPKAVYKSTMGTLVDTDSDTPIRSETVVDKNSKKSSSSNVVAKSVLSPTIGRPLREPAQVMRIWYAPWIDKGDGFNSSSYKFVEIAPRKWSFGKSESAMGGVVIPYRDASAEAPTVPSNPVTDPKDPNSGSALLQNRQSIQNSLPNISDVPRMNAAPAANLMNQGFPQ